MLGVDRFILSPTFRHLRLGLLTNHATVTSSRIPLAVALLRSGFQVSRIFSPEHGVAAQGEDGKKQSNHFDPLTGIPVVSLYGTQLAPSSNEVIDLDAIVVDLPNIGCRFYTYWWTITYLLEACASTGCKIILLDRPNLSKRFVSQTEGPMLQESSCSSFLGRWTMPLTFSWTYGQLARWFCHERKIGTDLIVVPTDPDDSIFIPPSPAINQPEAVSIYPCTGLFEGIEISNGRGTTFPFRVLGAPWINANQWQEDIRDLNIEGLDAVPFLFQPIWGMYEGQMCQGLFFNISDPLTFKPVEAGLQLLRYLYNKYPEHIRVSPYPTAANPTGQGHLDKLLGIPNSFRTVTTMDKSELRNLLQVDEWTSRVDRFLRD